MTVQLVRVAAGDGRLAAFHRGLYWDAFAAQHEPLEVWERALRGELPYELTITLALAGDALVGGIASEHYPRSGCGLVTYLVVAPAARNAGLGKRLQTAAVTALLARGAPAVLGELEDPRLANTALAWARVERNLRWGARILDTRYIQPALAPGLARDRGLLLVALAGTAPLPPSLPGGVIRSFVDELYAVTEHGPPDPEIAIGDVVPLGPLGPLGPLSPPR
jgi:GNAT superfamily N-acetyltransferase